MSQQVIRPPALIRRNRIALSLVALVLVLLTCMIAVVSYRSVLVSSEGQANSRLTLQMQGLINSLEKYRLMTPLLANRPEILAAFSQDQDDDDHEAALAAMSRIAGMSGAAEIELTFLSGTSVSMLDSVELFGKKRKAGRLNRPDIQQARQGRLGRHLLINEQGRFYIFSSAARIDSVPVGILSVYVDLDQTEQDWALFEQPIVAVSKGRVVLSNVKSWYDAPLVEVGSQQQIPDANLALRLKTSLFGPSLALIKGLAPEGGDGGDYVVAQHYDQLLDWTFLAMEPLRGPVYMAVGAGIMAALFSGLILGGLWVAFTRQQQELGLRRRDLASSLRLERRVRDRTKELRQTQAGLIHSAKLAAIGQMSAVISHEYNQPLAAIRSYADNAHLLFEKGRVEQGHDNLNRIGKLVDRLANLSKTLKAFARKPGEDVRPVSVQAVIDEAVLLMMPQLQKHNIALTVERGAGDFYVMAGHTRLEQVLINLISNGMDALVEARKQAPVDGRIAIFWQKRGNKGLIRVADSGPGIDPDIRAEIFEPFVTSKVKGEGLGLGLPIAFNLVKGFGGSLRLLDNVSGPWRTEFEICLHLAGDDHFPSSIQYEEGKKE